jgi:hypothetical protein
VADRTGNNFLLIFVARGRIMAPTSVTNRDYQEECMKKFLVVLLLIGIALPVLANDALVLPQGVGRVYVVPVYGWQTGGWDDDGEFESLDDDEGALTLFNLGLAGEYGVTDQISVGVQWAPGYNIVADFDDPGDDDYRTIRGAQPLRLGTEVGIVGSRGWVQSDMFRVQGALGFEAPFQPDWKTQGENLADESTYTDPQSFIFGVKPFFAIGGGLSFDYVVMDGFYLNLFSEFRQHFGRAFDLTDYYEAVGSVMGTPIGDPTADPTTVALDKYELEVDPFLEMDLEFDPNYTIALSDTFDLGFSLPITYAYTAQQDFTVVVEGDTAAGPGTLDTEQDEELDPSWTLTVGPTVSAFLTGLPVPLEFLTYLNLPVAGRNAGRTNQLVLEARVYFSTAARQVGPDPN